MPEVLHNVVVQQWEACERGSGPDPDGYSLHISESARRQFVDAYNAQLPGSAPETYSYASGTPYIAETDAATYAAVLSSKHGLRKQGEAPAIKGPIILVGK